MQELISKIEVQDSVSSSTLLSTTLHVGTDFWSLMEDSKFTEKWDALYHGCPWATAFQSREYVTAWYKSFEEQYQPVAVVAQQWGRMTGLLTMAIPADVKSKGQVYPYRVQVIGAGAYEAEYQVWMAEEENGESFIQAALELIKERFPKSDILFRFLPAGTPIGWISNVPVWRNRCVLQDFRRPLLELQNPAIPQLLRLTRQHKTKFNRLSRLGKVSFERITDSQQFAAILQDLAIQYDFRQGVMFNMNQFRESPQKKDFLMSLFKQGMLHVTVLCLNRELIAAMVATQGKGWVYLQGLNIHSPFYAKHSPGILHFFMLGQSLASEGYTVFDLTPGGDSYKERFATTSDQVYSLAVTDSKVYRLKRRIRKHVHAQLIKHGLRPMTTELNVKKQLYLIRNRLTAYRNGTWLFKRRAAVLAHFHAPLEAGTAPEVISHNNLQDLLNFERGGTSLTRWEFLEDAMSRFEGGQQAYTLSQHNRLLCCAWSFEQNQVEIETCKNALSLELTYCLPEAAGQLHDFLAATATELYGSQHVPRQLVLTNLRDTVLVKALLNAGFLKEN